MGAAISKTDCQLLIVIQITKARLSSFVNNVYRNHGITLDRSWTVWALGVSAWSVHLRQAGLFLARSCPTQADVGYLRH